MAMLDLVEMNKTCLMKMGWAFRKGKRSLQALELVGKYGRNGSTSNTLVVKATDSYIWKALTEQWSSFQEMEMWSIHNGTTINAWCDKWLDEQTMLSNHAIAFPDSFRIIVLSLWQS